MDLVGGIFQGVARYITVYNCMWYPANHGQCAGAASYKLITSSLDSEVALMIAENARKCGSAYKRWLVQETLTERFSYLVDCSCEFHHVKCKFCYICALLFMRILRRANASFNQTQSSQGDNKLHSDSAHADTQLSNSQSPFPDGLKKNKLHDS